MISKQEKQALRELLHQELDKTITKYYSKIRPKQFEKMMVQFGEMKIKETENVMENSTLIFGITVSPTLDDENRVFGVETVDELRKIFDISDVSQMENKMILRK